MDFEVDVEAAEVLAMLESVRRRLDRDRIPTFLGTTVVNYLRLRVDARFKSEGDDVSGKWPQLRPATAGHRVAMGYGAYHPINRRTGALWQYVRTWKLLNPTALQMPDDHASPFLQSKLKVAQLGGQRTAWMGPGGVSGSGPGPVPTKGALPRPVIGLNRRDARWITGQLYAWVMAGGA